MRSSLKAAEICFTRLVLTWTTWLYGTLLLFVKWMMGKASLWFHLFRPITHTCTCVFACPLNDQPAWIISAAAHWKEDLSIMRRWRKWVLFYLKGNGVQKSTQLQVFRWQCGKQLASNLLEKIKSRKNCYLWEKILMAGNHPALVHKMSFQLSLCVT